MKKFIMLDMGQASVMTRGLICAPLIEGGSPPFNKWNNGDPSHCLRPR